MAAERRRGHVPSRWSVLAVVAPLAAVAAVVALILNAGGETQQAPTTAVAPVATPATLKADRFDERRAMRLVRMQLAVGQRPAGSPQLRALAERLRRLLPAGRFEDLPAYPGLRNIVGELPGAGPAIVLGAHYDTEYHPKGFVGANDSAAGTAVLLEVARALQHVHRPAGAPAIRFVLFDGEEEPAPTTDFYADALRGSRSYVQAHAEEVRQMVLLDYVGNQGLRLPREATSDRGLWSRVRAAARTVGAGPVFPDATGLSIIDDHTPFLRARIPAVDLIDWDYRYKDTVRDTYDKLSARAVDAVGETIVELLRTS